MSSPLNLSALQKVVVLALAACVTLPVAASAATPPSGTVSETSPMVSWSGQPQPPTAEAVCDGPNDPTCDNFQLTILPPTSFDDFLVEIVVTPTGGDDYDLQVYDPFGAVAGSSGNSPGQPEQVNLLNPSAGTYTVAVANFAAALPFAGTATLSEITGGGGGGGGGESVTFALYNPPEGVGTNAGEPSVGANWDTGRLMYIAGLEVLRIDVNQCTSPARLEWTDVTFPLQGITTLDPILFTDSATGRTFASQLGPKCSSLAYTDDDGENWTPSQGCGINSGVDHQGIGGGPFAPPLTRDPDGPIYPNAVYYCSQDVAIAQCARSDTGGLTFADANPIYNLLECGGLHGHPKVAPDGTVYVPNKNCGGENAVAVSEANGVLGTWEVRRVPGTSSGTWDPSVGIASEAGSGANGTGVDTVYIGMVSNRRPFVAVSNDAGQSWSDIQDVGLGAGPLGGDIQNTAFPQMIAGDGDRAAFFFLGAEQPGDASGNDTTSPHIWYPYVSATFDGGVTWSTTNLSPSDPVQRGNVCSGGISCDAGRNLLDFNDVQVDREGRIVAAYADGCIGSCVKNPPNSSAELATVAIQVGGKRLFSEFDVETVPDAPKFEATLDSGDPNLVHITWVEPDDHGNAIFEYRVYRRFQGETEATLLAALPSSERSLDDFLAPNDPPPFYRVTAVNALGESVFCSELSPVAVEDEEDEDVCVPPGLTLAEDPAGDTNSIINPTGDPSLDLRRVSIAEPFTGPGEEKLVVTIEVEDLTIPSPSAAWRALWTHPDGVTQNFVSMETCDATAGVKCSYGTFDGTLFSSAGEPEGCTFNADGQIEIVVDKSLVGLDDSIHQAAFLGGVEGRTQLFIGALCTGLLGTADTAGPGDNHEIVTNAFCDGDQPEDPIARDDSATTGQDAPVVIDVVANDTSFNGSLSVVAVTAPSNGSVANNGDGTLTYQPDPGFYSPPADSFQYTIRDEVGGEDSATVTVNVNAACDAEPTGSFSDDFESGAPGWTVDTAVNNLPTSSPWAVVTDPSATSPTRSFSSDATTLDSKDDRLVAPAQDLSSTSQLVFWHRYEFENTYDGGVLEVSTDGGGSWVDVLSAGGAFVEGGYDGTIDTGFGSPIAGRAAWTGGDATGPMTRVTVDVGAYEGFSVLFRFRLAADPLAPGAVPGSGWWIDDVEFTNLLEIPSECPAGPEANDDAASTTVATSVTIDVLANDSHPDGEPIFLDSVDQPANGSVSINGDDTVTYDPDAGFTGVDSFTYQVCDGNGLCDGATVTVTVSDDPNGDPIARDDSAVTAENTPVTIAVLGNDEDPDGDPITVDSVTQPANGSAAILSDGSIEYTPDAGFSSPPDDTFTYTISDDQGATDTATVSVTVTPGPNGQPTANDDGATTSVDTAVTLDVLANDSDPDGDPLTVQNVSDPANGSAVANGDGTVTYTPDPGFAGTDVFTYDACDASLCDSATVTVNVVGEPDGSDKVTGGGWIDDGSGGKRNFGFNAKRKNSGVIQGRMTFDCGQGGICLKGTANSLRISGNVASFGGTCELGDGTACTYEAVVEDNGEPGDNDRFSIEVFDLTGATLDQDDDVLGGGNIQIH